MKKVVKLFIPPDRWKLLATVLLGIFFGIGAFSFHLSKAPSYLSDNPTTCINCHIMAPEYSTWAHSAHREYTNCNDCHVPHNNVFNHYYFKAKDGLRHATIFTLRAEPQVIQIKDDGANAVRNNCIRCHTHLINDPKMMKPEFAHNDLRKERKCWDCHREVPHGRVKGLSTTPYALIPLLDSPVPKWLKNVMNTKD